MECRIEILILHNRQTNIKVLGQWSNIRNKFHFAIPKIIYNFVTAVTVTAITKQTGYEIL